MKPVKNSFNYQNQIASQGSFEISQFLNTRTGVVSVLNTEQIKEIQPYGVDLLCMKYNQNGLLTHHIEIKTDTYTNTGNYFMETIANDITQREGGFLSTKSDWIFYYFINKKELHVMKTKETQNWFLINKDRFKKVAVPTVSNDGKRKLYNIMGYVVPIQEVLMNVKVWYYNLNQINYGNVFYIGCA